MTRYVRADRIPRDRRAYELGSNGDNRDCTVRAVSAALCLDYYQVQLAFCAAGRRTGWGANILTVSEVLCSLTGDHSLRYKSCARPTLAQFLRTLGPGHYIVCARRHAFAIIDGVVHDWGRQSSGARVRILCYWKVL